MSIYNYFFIGFIFTFFIEMIFDQLGNHPKLVDLEWGWTQRICCTILWPPLLLIFIVQFIKERFTK